MKPRHRFPRSGVTSPSVPEEELEPYLVRLDGDYLVMLGTRRLAVITGRSMEGLRTAVGAVELVAVAR